MESSPPDPQTAEERQKKEADLAYARGRKDADTEGRFKDIEDHFRKNNGQIGRMADELKHVNGCLEEIQEALAAMQTEQKTRDRVNQALKDAVTDSAAKQVSTRVFVSGVLGLLIALGGLILGAAA